MPLFINVSNTGATTKTVPSTWCNPCAVTAYVDYYVDITHDFGNREELNENRETVRRAGRSVYDYRPNRMRIAIPPGGEYTFPDETIADAQIWQVVDAETQERVQPNQWGDAARPMQIVGGSAVFLRRKDCDHIKLVDSLHDLIPPAYVPPATPATPAKK